MKNELIRKSIHLLMIIIPVSYLFLPRSTMLMSLGLAILISVVIELARFHWTDFSEWFQGLLGHLLRPHEKGTLTGSTYLFIGAFFAVLLFDQWVAMSALLFLIVSDAFGAISGRLWGGRLIYRNKRLSGIVVFILTAMMVVVVVPGSRFWIGMAGVVAACLLEVFIPFVDDNLSIPIGSGAVMQVLVWLFQVQP